MSARPTRPPGTVAAFDDGDVAPAAGQVQRRGQPGQPGADDDHAVGSSLDGAHQAARSVQTTAMSCSAARVISGIRRCRGSPARGSGARR